MALFFVTWEEMNRFGKKEHGEDLCQSDEAKNAMLKEMGKNAEQGKNTNNYIVYKLTELLDKYGLTVISKKEAALYGKVEEKKVEPKKVEEKKDDENIVMF